MVSRLATAQVASLRVLLNKLKLMSRPMERIPSGRFEEMGVVIERVCSQRLTQTRVERNNGLRQGHIQLTAPLEQCSEHPRQLLDAVNFTI